jgi:hypothetical protein
MEAQIMFFDNYDEGSSRIASEAEIQEIINWVFGPSSMPAPKRKTISLLGAADLRKPCAVGDKPEAGNHQHVCPDCSTGWQHPNDLSDSDISPEAHREAHTCPKCGEEQYWKAL